MLFVLKSTIMSLDIQRSLFEHSNDSEIKKILVYFKKFH